MVVVGGHATVGGGVDGSGGVGGEVEARLFANKVWFNCNKWCLLKVSKCRVLYFRVSNITFSLFLMR